MRSEYSLWADIALLWVALIWGGAFVAQRLGMNTIGPFTFNAARFALGGMVLLPIFLIRYRRTLTTLSWWRGSVLGGLLFGGSTLQQIGLLHTGAGKAGFITGLYVILVPALLALFWHERIDKPAWGGAVLAIIGVFLLSVQRSFDIAPGDAWVLAGSFFWALHVIFVGRLSPGYDALHLAMVQYFTCAILSLPFIVLLEPCSPQALLSAAPAIAYVGLFSTSLAYTIQMVGQKYTSPAHAALILSSESVFAMLFGMGLLHERLTASQWLGSAAILGGILLAQWGTLRNTSLPTVP